MQGYRVSLNQALVMNWGGRGQTYWAGKWVGGGGGGGGFLPPPPPSHLGGEKKKKNKK